jgi:exopolysaccharide biosynthesis polyprenyl glycosylphosphotransferase
MRVAADAVTAALAFVIAYYLRRWLPAVVPFGETLPLAEYWPVLVGVSLLWAWLLFRFDGRAPAEDRSPVTELRRLVTVSILGLLIVLSVGYAFRILFIPRTLIVSFVGVSYVFLLVERVLFGRWLERRFERDTRRRAVLVVGAGALAREFASRCGAQPGWGLRVVGFLSADAAEVGSSPDGHEVLGTYEDFPRLAHDLILDQVVIAAPLEDFALLREVFTVCDEIGLRVLVLSDWFLSGTSRLGLTRLGDRPALALAPTLEHEWQLFFKRVVDVVFSAAGLILLAPVFLVIAAAIKCSSEGPVFYTWRVVGFNRRPFVSYKFRTMYADADQVKKLLEPLNEMRGPVFKIKNDRRVTPVGRLLRKFSLDELPQLYSVLKGDMSLVGPRPPLVTEVPRFESWHRRKLSIKPGITCLWQIKGRSSITDFDDWVKLDLEYIDTWSLWLDLKILLRTIPAVLFARGAH